MSNYDVFQEVDEEVRREQLQKLWERYQNYVIAGVTLVILGVAAWRGYDWYVTKQAAETGADRHDQDACEGLIRGYGGTEAPRPRCHRLSRLA